ncbi:type VI secretion system baseplate subunit TssF [Trinickia acidisoli]|uniref:type VI secretion system baseplate subunit TssF n=1 Tax=Trinickia acidisoli TaxID=2767482 RepID=UPI001A8C3867|nr:type VI secretion system baseplate subunit TssF [Trinickia acidisoli]
MDEFEKLLPYFERELAQLRQDMLQFERAHPKAAARLSMSGGQTDDPHVERMLQSAAWLNARSAKRIDDHYPEFTDALIETVFPAYLKPIPSCSIAQFDVDGMFDGLTRTVVMPRGTKLEHRPSLCRFNTAWDVTLAPLGITRAQFSPPTAAPPLGIGQLPSDMLGIVTIEFVSSGHVLTSGSELLPQALRIYLNADRFLTAALIDALLLHPQTAFVEADGSRRWQALEKTPASAVGFADDEAIMAEPQHAREPALRLLLEYAAFPRKFHFIDIDFAQLLRAAGPCSRLALHLPVVAQAANAAAIQRLGQLDAGHLQLFCAPVINLFEADAKPIDVTADTSAYPVALPSSDGAPAVIHSIDSVRIMHGVEGGTPGAEIPPHKSLQHESPVGMFWLQEKNSWDIGRGTAIRLVDLDEQPVTPDASKLAIKLTCTNGQVPTTIGIGAPDGDLHSEALNLGRPITMLVNPSASSQPPYEDRALWRLLSALSPNHAALSPSGLFALQALLYQLAKPAPPDASRYIAGISGLSSRTIKRMMRIEPIPMPVLVPGIQVTLTIDGAAFAGHSLYIFALLMERYFLRYADQDCIELIVSSQHGADLYRGKPQLGPPGLGYL